MLTRLLVLWLLSEQSHHGYRIKKILDDEALRFWFPVEYASIYAVLRSLVRAGYVESVAVEREGQRPERTRYAITREGRRHLSELLERAWRELPAVGDPLGARTRGAVGSRGREPCARSCSPNGATPSGSGSHGSTPWRRSAPAAGDGRPAACADAGRARLD